MRVAHRHLHRAVPQELLDGLHRHAAHHEMRRERVTKRVPADPRDPGARTRARAATCTGPLPATSRSRRGTPARCCGQERAGLRAHPR
jgi:hypothetical protein